MPDTLKEFYNNDVTLTSLQAGVTLVSTTSTQTAVVKDIEMNNPNARDIDFRVGGTTLISSNSSLNGSEIIGASSSLTMTNSSQPTVNRLFGFDTTANYRLHTTPTVFGPPSNTMAFTQAYPAFTTALTTTPYFACITASGDFFYAGGNVNTLYKRTGGINGTQTSTNAPSNCWIWAYDGSRYIYGYSNSPHALYEYDIQTNTWATRAYTNTAFNMSYCSMVAIDRYVILQPDATTSVPTLVNGATGVAVGFFGNNIGFNWSATGAPLGIKKNSRGEYIMVYTYNDSVNWQLAYVNMGTSLATVNLSTLNRVNADTNATSWWPTGSAWTTNQRIVRDDTVTTSNPYLYLAGSGTSQLTLFNVDTFQVIKNSSGNSTFQNAIVASVNPTTANSDFGTIRVRATGVLSE